MEKGSRQTELALKREQKGGGQTESNVIPQWVF